MHRNSDCTLFVVGLANVDIVQLVVRSLWCRPCSSVTRAVPAILVAAARRRRARPSRPRGGEGTSRWAAGRGEDAVHGACTAWVKKLLDFPCPILVLNHSRML